MEFLILIPIIAFIWGWCRTNPAVQPPPDLKPVSSNTFMSEDDDSYFSDSDDIFAGVDSDDTFADVDSNDASMANIDSNDWDGHTLADDLMFDPANSWCDFNIYHHHDE